MQQFEQMSLAAFLSGNPNYHIAGWRHADAFADAACNVSPWIELARNLEAAKFDILFLADAPGFSVPVETRGSSIPQRTPILHASEKAQTSPSWGSSDRYLTGAAPWQYGAKNWIWHRNAKFDRPGKARRSHP